MAKTALAAFATYIVLAFGLRSIVQWRRTGATGFKGISGDFGSLEWVGGAMFLVALLLAPTAALLEWRGVVTPIPFFAGPTVRVLAIFLYGMGLVGTLVAQLWMGDAWRIGVDASERTTLITNGPFAYIRNPIFAALLLAAAGLALMVPNAVALVAFSAMLAAIEIQVRAVEEPYLLRTQDSAYRDYVQRVGRFVPGVGLMNDPEGRRERMHSKESVEV